MLNVSFQLISFSILNFSLSFATWTLNCCLLWRFAFSFRLFACSNFALRLRSMRSLLLLLLANWTKSFNSIQFNWSALRLFHDPGTCFTFQFVSQVVTVAVGALKRSFVWLKLFILAICCCLFCCCCLFRVSVVARNRFSYRLQLLSAFSLLPLICLT